MKEILKQLIDNNYEAYIVGGYVRDFILGKNSYDIDIITNAPIDKIKEIFKDKGKTLEKYYNYNIKIGKYNYDITSYRKELKYYKNKPVEIEYAKTKEEDLKRRDFTINTLLMDIDQNIIDYYNAKDDIKNKIIKTVSNIDKSFKEDKTRIIRALRLSSSLDFELDKDILLFIEKNKECLLDIPREYIKKELDKIFQTNSDKFIYYCDKLNLYDYLNIKFDKNKIIKTNNLYLMWSFIDTTLPFSKKERKLIEEYKKDV